MLVGSDVHSRTDPLHDPIPGSVLDDIDGDWLNLDANGGDQVAVTKADNVYTVTFQSNGDKAQLVTGGTGAASVTTFTQGTTTVAEVQKVTVNVAAGTFTLSYDANRNGIIELDETTGPLAWDATAAQVKAALERLMGDRLNVYDSGDDEENTGRINWNESTGIGEITELGMQLGIRYQGFEHFIVELSDFRDTFYIESTPTGADLTLHGGDENPVLNQPDDVVHINKIGGDTIVDTGNGNDIIRVNYSAPLSDRTGLQTGHNGIGGLLTLIGGKDSDTYEIGLSGEAAPNGDNRTLIVVSDGSNVGINQLRVFGNDDPNLFLLRAGLPSLGAARTASISAYEVDDDNLPVDGGFFERVSYDSLITSLQIEGRDGDDTFVLDDNLAQTIINGGAGDDTFQVGQVFQSARDGSNPDNGLDPSDYFQTTLTTRGFLSNGISRATTLFGGTGKDNFTVYHNLAELLLFGEEDDDTFTRARLRPRQPERPAGAVHEHQRRPGRRLHLLHRQRAGADRRRRRPRHAGRRRHRVRRRLRGHRPRRLRRRPVHHLRGHRAPRRRRAGGQRPLLHLLHAGERRARAARQPRLGRLHDRRQPGPADLRGVATASRATTA